MIEYCASFCCIFLFPSCSYRCGCYCFFVMNIPCSFLVVVVVVFVVVFVVQCCYRDCFALSQLLWMLLFYQKISLLLFFFKLKAILIVLHFCHHEFFYYHFLVSGIFFIISYYSYSQHCGEFVSFRSILYRFIDFLWTMSLGIICKANPFIFFSQKYYVVGE